MPSDGVSDTLSELILSTFGAGDLFRVLNFYGMRGYTLSGKQYVKIFGLFVDLADSALPCALRCAWCVWVHARLPSVFDHLEKGPA